MLSVAAHISRLAGGHIPAVVVLEDMCRIAHQFGRDEHYVLRQTVNLMLGREGLPELHEACGYDARRCFKVLLAYEEGIIHREALRTEIFAKNEAAFYGLEALVDVMLDVSATCGELSLA